MAGCLSYEEFEGEARQLVDMSDTLGDGWELRHVRTTEGPELTAYLVKKRSVTMETPAECAPGVAGEPEIIQDPDPAELQCCPPRSLVNFEYHVIYSPSYQVPVLYFTVSNDSGKLVPLRDFWGFVSPFHVTRESGMEWESVTQQEHPILCRPFYHVHPCHTPTIMATTLTNKPSHDSETGTRHGNSRSSYLLSWLTTFGPTIGLSISLDYLKLSIQKQNCTIHKTCGKMCII